MSKKRHLIITSLSSMRDRLLRAYAASGAKVNHTLHEFESDGDTYKVVAGVVPSDLERLRGEVFASCSVHPYTSKDVRDIIPQIVRVEEE